MRRFLRSAKTGLFLADNGKWMPGLTKARAFPTVLDALSRAARLHAPDVEIYYSFDDKAPSQFDFSIAPH